MEQDEDNHQVRFLLGEQYLKSGQLSEALYSFSLALKGEDATLKTMVLSALKSCDYPSETAIEPVQLNDRPTDNEVFTPSHAKAKTKGLKVIHGQKQSNIVSLENRIPKEVKFDDVGGLGDLKKTNEMKIIKPFVNPGLFAKFHKKAGGSFRFLKSLIYVLNFKGKLGFSIKY